MTSSVADALVGRVIDGRYRIISHLADGGMASVYVAMDARLDRHVALKIMRPGLARDDVFVERFRSEARAAARLSHPNVVAVFDQGEDGDDVFLAMELVEGKTLRDVIHQEAPLTAREALAILEPILAALRAAHGAGLIHRDVKPENVIVRHDGEVKVADFGLARAITDQTVTSQTGVLLGTVSYLSPEQVERGFADPRSDVYAAGLLLFEMLTGRKAVIGETPIQIAYRHVHDGVAAPSSVVSSVPPDLDDLVARATEVEPDHRFGSAAEFLAAMREVRRILTPGELDRRPTDAETALGPAVQVGRDESAPDGDGQTTRVTPLPDGASGAGEQRRRFVLAAAPVHEAPAREATAALPLGTGARDAARPPRRRARRRWPWALAALLLALGGAGGWWFTAGPGGTTRVPTVVSASLEEATSRIELASLRVESSEAFSETVPQGEVISARPQAGTEVAKQSTVVVLVSKGPERYTVPRLVGTKAAGAKGLLKPLTLVLGRTRSEWSETVPEGVVTAQDPPAGQSVRRGTAVELVVSKGRRPVPVPDVVKLPLAQATKRLTDAGLKVVRGKEVNHDTIPAGHVVAQSPRNGTLFRGDEVTLTISKGPVLVAVPGVVGRNAAEAEKLLTDLGFVVQKEYPFGSALFDQVRVQSVPQGQKVPKGTTITLTIV